MKNRVIDCSAVNLVYFRQVYTEQNQETKECYESKKDYVRLMLMLFVQKKPKIWRM